MEKVQNVGTKNAFTPIYIYIYILYTKLTYFNHPNKNVEHPNWESQEFEFNKNKSNITFTIFLQSFHNKFYLVSCY